MTVNRKKKPKADSATKAALAERTRLKGRVLHLEGVQFVLPFGTGLRADELDDYAFIRGNASAKRGVSSLSVTYTDESGLTTELVRKQLQPAYSARDSITVTVGGKEVKAELDLWAVSTDLDRLKAREVVQREHYLSDPGRGMILACRFKDANIQTAIRKAARAKRSKDKDADQKLSWLIPAGGIVACAFVSEMSYRNPRSGRRMIADKLGKAKSWSGIQSSSEARKVLRVCWASRFAVDEPYHGIGIGTVLAKHLMKIARHYRLPHADFIEVITTAPRKRVGVSDKGRDFLQKAGYIQCSEPLKSRQMMRMDVKSGLLIPEPAVKRYYYADLRKIKL